MEIFTERRIYMIVSFLFILGFLWWINSLPDKPKNDNAELDALAGEAKIAIKKFNTAVNDAASLIEASNQRIVVTSRGSNAKKLNRTRLQSTPLRNGIRALKTKI